MVRRTKKERAIRQVAKELHDALQPTHLANVTLVPMPPSLAKDDPEHDDRMLQVLIHLSTLVGGRLDIRELLYFAESVRRSRSEERPDPDELRRSMRIDPALVEPRPRTIWLFDDLITQGTHFRVAKDLLRAHLGPSTNVYGVFAARVVSRG